jgi:hypothetical protein
MLVKNRSKLESDKSILQKSSELDMSDWSSYGGCFDEPQLAANALAVIALSDKSSIKAMWHHNAGVKFGVFDFDTGKKNISAAATNYGIDEEIAMDIFCRSSYSVDPTLDDVAVRIETLLDFDLEEEDSAGHLPRFSRFDLAKKEWKRICIEHNRLLVNRELRFFLKAG